jgi:hypothetical protein
MSRCRLCPRAQRQEKEDRTGYSIPEFWPANGVLPIEFGNWGRTERFPGDFMIRLSAQEFANLKSQLVISSWGGIRRATPYAFTEQGVGSGMEQPKSFGSDRVSITEGLKIRVMPNFGACFFALRNFPGERSRLRGSES